MVSRHAPTAIFFMLPRPVGKSDACQPSALDSKCSPPPERISLTQKLALEKGCATARPHDLQGADVLLPQMQADSLLADKAFDADERVIEPLLAGGKKFVIPPKSNRKVQRLYDKELYKARHLMENFYCKLKQYRAIATRYDKTARNFLAGIHLAAAVIWLN
jgi:transposase